MRIRRTYDATNCRRSHCAISQRQRLLSVSITDTTDHLPDTSFRLPVMTARDCAVLQWLVDLSVNSLMTV